MTKFLGATSAPGNFNFGRIVSLYSRINLLYLWIETDNSLDMVKYPVSESSFSEIRKGGYAYVDKTQYVHQLAESGKFFFLSRPRRFGKSMLISTMENYFRGNRELFRGLAIDRLEPGEWTRYPVLHLDFTQRGYNAPDDLRKALSDTLDRWEKEYGAPNPDDSPDGRFNRLINEIFDRTGRQVVILIDEYDSPVVDAYGNHELEMANRKTLHDFYRVMKANTDSIRFVFLTGVGKLGQINIFSGLNNLMDISLLPDYSAICGITREELLEYFREGIEEMAQRRGWTFDETLDRLKKKYDGYHFSEDLIDVYNPFSVVRALYSRNIGDYWFQSGTPTRLVKQFLESDWGTPDLEGIVVSRSMLESGDVLGGNLELACFYTGYLTIKDYDPEFDEFTLGYPNTEVRNGFFNSLLRYAKNWDSSCTDNFVRSLRRFIRNDDIDGFLRELQSFLAGIPYMNYTDKEPQWQKDILIIGRLVGLDVEVEKRSSCGRMDMVVEGAKAIYILEFKYDGTPEKALRQIDDKAYALQFQNSLNPKPVVKVGVNISSKTHNIDTWQIIR